LAGQNGKADSAETKTKREARKIEVSAQKGAASGHRQVSISLQEGARLAFGRETEEAN
jgi:hypothetical protein